MLGPDFSRYRTLLVFDTDPSVCELGSWFLECELRRPRSFQNLTWGLWGQNSFQIIVRHSLPLRVSLIFWRSRVTCWNVCSYKIMLSRIFEGNLFEILGNIYVCRQVLRPKTHKNYHLGLILHISFCKNVITDDLIKLTPFSFQFSVSVYVYCMCN